MCVVYVCPSQQNQRQQQARREVARRRQIIERTRNVPQSLSTLRLARWQRERVPTIQAAARGLAARVAYRRRRGAATAIAAGTRGLFARSRARGRRHDPELVYRWERFVAVRALVDELDGRLADLAASREAETGQLALALAHEQDKLGAAYRDAPAVGVMLKQQKLAQQDAVDIGVGQQRSASLIALLRQVPFARAADATQAVATEVAWLHELVEQQSRRDELYRPASHRPGELMRLFGSPPSKLLSREAELDSYRSVSPSRAAGAGASHQRGAVGDDDDEPTEAELAAERARRAAARRVVQQQAAPPAHGRPPSAWSEAPAAAKKWTGKGPPPPGWGKARPLPPPPPGFQPGTAAAANPDCCWAARHPASPPTQRATSARAATSAGRNDADRPTSSSALRLPSTQLDLSY